MANGNIITTKRARPRLGGSAQARWMRKQKARGNCRACGEPRPAELKQLCRPCQDKVNAYMKTYRTSRKQPKGGRSNVKLQSSESSSRN